MVQVAQPMSVRSRAPASVALRTVLPPPLLLPLLGALVWRVWGCGVGRCDGSRWKVPRRSSDALQPIGQDGLPEEKPQPLIGSLNGLLQRFRTRSKYSAVSWPSGARAAHAGDGAVAATPARACGVRRRAASRHQSRHGRPPARDASGGGLPLVGGLRTLEQLGLQRQRRHRRAQRACAASATKPRCTSSACDNRCSSPLSEPIRGCTSPRQPVLADRLQRIRRAPRDFQRDPSQRVQAASHHPPYQRSEQWQQQQHGQHGAQRHAGGLPAAHAHRLRDLHHVELPDVAVYTRQLPSRVLTVMKPLSGWRGGASIELEGQASWITSCRGRPPRPEQPTRGQTRQSLSTPPTRPAVRIRAPSQATTTTIKIVNDDPQRSLLMAQPHRLWG